MQLQTHHANIWKTYITDTKESHILRAPSYYEFRARLRRSARPIPHRNDGAYKRTPRLISGFWFSLAQLIWRVCVCVCLLGCRTRVRLILVGKVMHSGLVIGNVWFLVGLDTSLKHSIHILTANAWRWECDAQNSSLRQQLQV